MRAPSAALGCVFVLACRSRSADSPPPPSPLPPPGDAGPAAQSPAVATPAFVGALLTGAQPWSRVVDPRFGVFELRSIDGDRRPVVATAGWRCGAEREQALARLRAAAAPHAGDEAKGYKFACIDSLDDARPTASCAIYADADDAPGFSLVFVPDRSLGLRLTGVLMGDERAIPEALDGDFDVQVERADARCP